MQLRLPVLWFLSLLLLVSACDDRHPTRSVEPEHQPEWHFLGLDGTWVTSLELDYPYLYACGWQSGLYRCDVRDVDPEWEHLGLSVSDFPDASSGILQDVLVIESDTLLAASSYRMGDGTNLPGVHRSENWGATWAAADSGIRMSDGRVCRVTCLTGCDHFIYAGTIECGTFRSGDRGRYWSLSGDSRWGGYSHIWIEQSPADCSVIWQCGSTAIESYAMAASQDHGETWSVINSLGYGFLDTYVIALDPADANVAYVGTYDSISVTHDLGESFDAILRLPEGARTWALACEGSGKHLFALAGLYRKDTEILEHLFYDIHDAGASVDTLAIPITGYAWELLHDEKHQALYVAAQGGVYQYEY